MFLFLLCGGSMHAQYYAATATSGAAIQSSGNVGIGIISPLSNLTIQGVGTPKAVLEVLGESSTTGGAVWGISTNTIKDNSLWVHNQGNVACGTGHDGNPIYCDFQNTILIAKGNSQEVGIGIYEPQAKLHIVNDAIESNSRPGAFWVQTNSLDAIYTDADGSTGIGTSAPSTRLHVYGKMAGGFDLFQVANDKMTAIYVTNTGFTGIGTATPTYQLDVNGSTRITGNEFITGKVVIGTVPYTSSTTAPNLGSDYSLYVEKGVIAEKFKCALKRDATNWSDYVFEKNYKLTPLKEVETYIKANKHLPGVPSAEEVYCDGIDMAQMDATLLKKIEELTLYVLQLQRDNEAMKAQFLKFSKN